MKKPGIFLSILISAFFITYSLNGQTPAKHLQDSARLYKDGVYKGASRSIYTYEPYWGIVNLTIKNGQIDKISFIVRDSNLHENFDGAYEKHFTGNDVYVNQSRNDWAGVQAYPKKLSEVKDLDKVDATSGATWSYNIFKASVNDALKNAK